MRVLLCENCSKDKREGTRELYARSSIGEPAEIERVTFGVAAVPQARQREMSVDGEVKPLPPDHYNCDTCTAKILPGEKCCAWTVWTENQQPIHLWEDEYLRRSEPQ